MKRPSRREVRLSLRPTRPVIGRLGGAVHVLIHAEPPAAPIRSDRRPVALALVIDRSGSMGDPATGSTLRRPVSGGTGQTDTGVADKLSFVKAATRRLLDLMRDGDAVALVTFEDTVNVVKPLTVLEARSRHALVAAVDRLHPGGSTNLEGGFRAGLEQLAGEPGQRYGCKLVLLSDGEANVGESRPAVLAEVAASAAREGITTSALGVGNSYNLALMTAMAEGGNGDFSHIHALETLDDILREEFTTSAEVTARALEVSVWLPERLASGTNLNGYRQESTESGFRVLLGDLVRPKEFLFELTTPVPLDGDELTITARAAYRDTEHAAHETSAQLTLSVCEQAQALRAPVDEEVMAKLLTQLPARAEIDALLAYDSRDFGGASAAVGASRRALDAVRRQYGMAVEARPELGDWDTRLARLDAGTAGRRFAAADVKAIYAASLAQSRSRPRPPQEPMR